MDRSSKRAVRIVRSNTESHLVTPSTDPEVSIPTPKATNHKLIQTTLGSSDRTLSSQATSVTPSTTDQRQYSNQIIENFDITSAPFQQVTRYRHQNFDTSSFSTISTGTAERAIENFPTIGHNSLFHKEIAGDDASYASGSEPRESSAPGPTVTLKIDHMDNSEKLFRRRRAKFVQAMNEARRSSREAQNIIRNITDSVTILPTLSEARSFPIKINSNGPINLVTDRIDGTKRDIEQEQQKDEEDDIIRDTSIGNIPVITSPTKKNQVHSFRRKKTQDKSQTENDDQLKSQTIFRMKRKPFQPPHSKSSTTNEPPTPTSRLSNTERSNSNISNDIPQKSVTFQDYRGPTRATTPGIIEELSGNITKEEPGRHEGLPSLVQQLTGNITKTEPDDSVHSDRETSGSTGTQPIPGTAQHVPGKDKSKFVEFISAINKDGLKSNRSLDTGHGRRRIPQPGPLPQYTRRPFSFHRIETPSVVNSRERNDIGNDNSSFNQESLASVRTDSSDNETMQQSVEAGTVEGNTNHSTSSRSWHNGHAFAVATPVPVQRNESSQNVTSVTNSIRTRKSNPFKDRYVVTVLGCLLIIIAVLTFAYISERGKREKGTLAIPKPQIQTEAKTPASPPPLPMLDLQSDFRNISSAILLSHDDDTFFREGCMFNINMKGVFNPLSLPKYKIASIDMLLTKGQQIPVQVWATLGGYKEFQSTDFAWVNLVDSAFVDGNGPDEFTHVANNLFSGAGQRQMYLWEGSTIGVYVTVAEKGLDSMLVKAGIEEEKPFVGNNETQITDGICLSYPFSEDEEITSKPMRWLGSVQLEELTLTGIVTDVLDP